MIKIILYPLSFLYYILVSVHRLCYQLKLFSTAKFNAQIISIGNIEVGGTGKTPMTIYLSTILTQNNISHVLVSRGYKRSSSGTVIVSDGKRLLVSSVKDSGDEPLLLAHKLPSIPIVVGNNKRRAINIAIQTFQPKVIILDDAFQSHYIHKNIDVVLFNCLHSKKQFHLLPAGLLRAPISSLSQASLVVFTKQNLLQPQTLLGPTKQILEFLKNKNIPYLFSNYQSFYHEYDFNTKKLKASPLVDKNDLPALAFCGIGDPKSFKVVCKKFFIAIITTRVFADHYHYKFFVNELNSLYHEHSFSAIVTTYKDFIKLSTGDSKILSWLQEKNIRVFIVEIEVFIEGKNNKLSQLIKTLAL